MVGVWPLEGLRVFLDNVGSVPFATTGADGSYSLTVPASPDYQLRLGNTFSNASTAIPAFTLRADLPVEADTVLDLTIPVGPFTYVVQDNTNSPILGVTVRPEGNFETSVEVAPGLTMTGSVDLVTSGLDTDSNGEAVFGVLPADRQTFVEVTPPVESGLLPVFVDDVDPQPNAQTIITFVTDSDEDGITDDVDPAPSDPTNTDFDDGEGTTGEILAIDGLELVVRDGSNGDPTSSIVQIQARTDTGEGTAVVELCTDWDVELTGGDEVLATCGSLTLGVVEGPAQIVAGGGQVRVTVPSGVTVRLDGVSPVIVEHLSGTDDVLVTDDGDDVALGPGESGQFALPPVDPVFYLSSTTGGQVDGLSFADEDILSYDSGSGLWSMVFDGSDVNVGGSDVDAFHLLSLGPPGGRAVLRGAPLPAWARSDRRLGRRHLLRARRPRDIGDLLTEARWIRRGD